MFPQPKTLAQSHHTLPKQSVCWFLPRDLRIDSMEEHNHLASPSQEQDKEQGYWPGDFSDLEILVIWHLGF